MKNRILFFSLINVTMGFCQIENGMLMHLPMNGNLLDVSQSNVSITNNGSVYTSDRNGDPNAALNFNNSSFISTSDTILKQQFPISVAYWLRLNSLNDVNILFKTDNVFSNHYGVWMNNLSSGGLTLSFGGGLGTASSTNQRYYTTNNTISAGVWHHVVGIIRSYNDMDIYIDCIKTTGTYGGTGLTDVVYSTDGESRIGGCIGNTFSPNDFYVDGQMDQFVFWNRELILSEINFLCDNNNTLELEEISSEPKKVVKVIDLLGREIEPVKNEVVIYVYSDGSTEKRIVIE